MSKTMVLGLNCAHDAAACLTIDGKVMVAVSEERLARQKHKSGFPKLAINYCLKEAGLDRESVIFDSVVINQQPPADYDCIAKQYFPAMPGSRVLVNPSHHYLHACYALTLTDQRPLVILVVDGSGYSYAEHRRRGSPLLGSEPRDHDMWESLTAFYVDTDGEWSLLIKDWGLWKDSALRFPSLGHMYGLAAQRIFGSWVHAGKVMGLAPYGNPLGLGEEPIVTLTENGIEVNTDWILKMPSITFNSNFEEVQTARDLAAKVQAELECSMMHLCGILHARTKCDSICVTGGVALNSVFNGRLATEGPFRNVVVSPAAHDGGTAIGAAAYGFNQVTGRQLEFQRDPEFLGRVYSEREVWEILTQYPESKVEKCTCAIQSAAPDLASGKMVGWFEGGAEFGPRALGHRSILGNPAVPEMKDMLNRRVKFRESFRPYAAGVLLEHAAARFENPPERPPMPL